MARGFVWLRQIRRIKRYGTCGPKPLGAIKQKCPMHRVARLVDQANWKSFLPAVDSIFFATSRIQLFGDERERHSFKAKWLDRYLNHHIDSFFVARTDDGDLAGYLAGCLENPTLNPLFNDLGYYKFFAPYCASYPCHLHVNVAAHYRNHGIGAALVEAFGAQALNAQSSGIHVVTNEGARNVRFYERNNFRILSTTNSNGTRVVFMGRQLKQN
jgi:GNAT superfamily N-acetyltransferase